jgi:sarcosine oxidase subunit alpha
VADALRFEGRRVAVEPGDTVASALYRAGVRTFTRSLKYHRRRGLFCMTGDCPNCSLNVDGDPGVRACTTDARDGQVVLRESGWPSAEHDLLHVTDRLHRFLPVGFYSKTFIRPRFVWGLAERVIRRATGVGRLPAGRPAGAKPARAVHVDLLVVGGGVAGLAAAAEAAAAGSRVVLVEERRLGATVWDARALTRIEAVAQEATAAGARILEHHMAVGVYEGPFVPVVGPNEVLHIEAGRVIAATGAVEAHAVFPGNDLPGVFLSRGAALLGVRHGVGPGRRAVVVATTDEGRASAEAIRTTGVEVLIHGGPVIEAEGSGRVRAVIIETPGGRERITCDTLVLSLGWAPRDALLRMGTDQEVAGAGEVVIPGCSLEEAEASGRRAAIGQGEAPSDVPTVPVAGDGYLCLCEDVSVHDLEQAWDEGWRSSEILKRYTTATMGPCQGAVCGRLLAAFAGARADAVATAGARTTARPPARPLPLEDLAAGVDGSIEQRTSLHDRHLELGARMERSGSWARPTTFGDIELEIGAVRHRAGLLDVGTLGKFLVAGRDAAELMDRVFPVRVRDLTRGSSRYLVALDEAGYVIDDGLLAALDRGRFHLSSTSGGAPAMEAWLRDWIDRWDLHVHLLDQTAQLGAILLAGPNARKILERLTDDDVSAEVLPHMRHADITVADVPCRALRVGFVGEVGFELHHDRSRGPGLYDALLEAGRPEGAQPFGLGALDTLRLEKGHLYLGQDTLPDDHPAKLGLEWAVAMDKPRFVGKAALERMAALPLERTLVGLRIEGEPRRGVPLLAGGRVVGRVTSCARSDAAGGTIALGWVRAVAGSFPTELLAGESRATVVPTPFYDPEGVRLRA